MKNKEYDFVFLTNTPSFYKVNLCNQIALTHSVLLVLYGYGSEAVNTMLNANHCNGFDYVFLHNGASEQRNKWKVFIRLIRIMKDVNCKKILYSGWFVPEYNILSFFTPKDKNCLICESSAFETTLSGVKGKIKKMIINRMGTALPSGEPHKKIFDQLGYKGKIVLTGGVGIFNKQPRTLSMRKQREEFRYLYVGRLIECKNIRFLVQQFNRLGKQLTIVGSGELETELKQMAGNNITFLGFVENGKLKEVYQQHDVFILPSKSETWGLVVDEALYWGLPVIASDRVGSSADLVEKLNTGCLFSLELPGSLNIAMNKIEQNYQMYIENVRKIDFECRDRKQVEAYTKLIEK